MGKPGRRFQFSVRALQITSIVAPLATNGYLVLVTEPQAAALKGPLLIGGFTATQVSCAIAGMFALAYVVTLAATAAVRKKRANAGANRRSLFATYAIRTELATSFHVAILGALGAAWIIDRNPGCLVGSVVASALCLLHLPSIARVREWIEPVQAVGKELN